MSIGDAIVAQSVEHYIGNVEVAGSNPVDSSKKGKVYTLPFFVRADCHRNEKLKAASRGILKA